MNKKSIAAILAGALLVIVVAVAASTQNEKAATTATPSPTPSVAASATPSPAASVSEAPTATPESSVATISFSGTNFSPSMTTVKSGSQIRFTNQSNRNVEVGSDPHPSHTSNSELNLGVIAPGQSKTVTVTKTGAYGIHDHLNSSITAKITVQ